MSRFKKITDALPEWGRFNSWPAAMIDRAFLQSPKGWLSKTWHFVKIRAIFLTLFFPLTLIDLFVSGVLGARYSFGTFFLADDLQDKRLAQQKIYTTIFSKNLYALLSTLVGLINPRLVAFYFTPENTAEKGVTSGGGYYQSEDAELFEPKTVEEVQELVLKAPENGQKIMVVGAGRSQGKQFLPEGGKPVVVDLSQMELPHGSIVIDPERKIATVGAAVCWADLQNEADKHKLALAYMQASNVFSVGGSIGTDIHGWKITGTLADSILEMEFIDGEGQKHSLTPGNELFHQITSGFGIYGIITKIKLQLIDNEKLYERGKEVAPTDYVRHFKENVENKEYVRMHLYRLSLDPKNLLGSGVAVDYVKEDEDPPCTTPNLKQEGNRGTRFNQVMINLARRIPWIRKKYWEGERDRVLANNSPAMTTNEIMQPPINAMFNPSVSEAEWLQEYFLPEEELAAFLQELGPLLQKNEVALLNASVRFVKHNPDTHKSPLSYASDGDRFAVVLCFNQSLEQSEVIKAKKWLREAQHKAVEHGGSYYLPYQHVSSPKDFNKAYPRAAAEVPETKNKVDPHGIFTSGFYQKYLNPQSQQTNQFEAVMASEESKKKFAGFLKNVLHRVDADKFYDLLTDIMSYNDTHAEIYQELCKRLPEIMPSAIGDFSRILTSLSTIKEDLAEQAKAILPEEMTKINGLVEIGYPGRFVDGFKKNFKVTGPIVAVHENEPSLTDYIQTGFPRPYDQYQKLNYNKPNLHNLKTNSADVITCYVGLHHFPEDELEAFLKEIRRVLRPGGHFLLVDHDVDEESLSMAHMAHTVFNAVTGVSLQEELNERRNFRPMAYWKDLLGKHGLGYAVKEPEVEMIREDDPSRNRMVSFVNTKAPKLNHVHFAAANEGEEELQSKKRPSSSEPNARWRENLSSFTFKKNPQTGLFNQEEEDERDLSSLSEEEHEERKRRLENSAFL